MAAQLSLRPSYLPIDWDYRPDDFFFIDEGLVPAPFNKVAIQPILWAARFTLDASLAPAEPPPSLAGLAARYWAKHPPAISKLEDNPGRCAREVDIARITIRSTLSDTTCVTARRDAGHASGGGSALRRRPLRYAFRPAGCRWLPAGSSGLGGRARHGEGVLRFTRIAPASAVEYRPAVHRSFRRARDRGGVHRQPGHVSLSCAATTFCRPARPRQPSHQVA